MQKVIKIVNLLIICAILFTVFNYNKHIKTQKPKVKKSYNYPGAVYFPYTVINSTKESDSLYKYINGENKYFIYIIDNYSKDDRYNLQNKFYENNLQTYYEYVPMGMPRAGEIKCADGTKNCFIYYFTQRCVNRNVSMCIIHPKTRELLAVPKMTTDQMIEFLIKHKEW